MRTQNSSHNVAHHDKELLAATHSSNTATGSRTGVSDDAPLRILLRSWYNRDSDHDPIVLRLVC